MAHWENVEPVSLSVKGTLGYAISQGAGSPQFLNAVVWEGSWVLLPDAGEGLEIWGPLPLTVQPAPQCPTPGLEEEAAGQRAQD